MAYCNGFIYYINDNRTLFRIPYYHKNIIISSGMQLIAKSVIGNINILNNFLYYYNGISFFKINTDLQKKSHELIFQDQDVTNIIVTDEWIYYLNKDHNICRCKINGTFKSTLYTGSAKFLNIYNSLMYFCQLIYDGNIYCMDLEGTNIRILKNFNLSQYENNKMIVNDSYIFLLNDQSLYKYDLYTHSTNLIVQPIINFNVYDGSVYYIKKLLLNRKELHKIVLESMHDQILSKISTNVTNDINILNDKVYYVQTRRNRMNFEILNLWVVDLDGQNNKKFILDI